VEAKTEHVSLSLSTTKAGLTGRFSVFASWDAEEYAMIGSTEWVEEYAPWLRDTAISYLNIDIGVAGPLPGAAATPELRTIAQEIMKKVIYNECTLLNSRTLYDAWYTLYQFHPEDSGFSNLGSGSDYIAFLQLGIPVLDFGMDASRGSPVYHYHSNYDSYHWMKTMVDPDFSIHATVGRFVTLLAYHLADDVIIPFDMDTFARNINYYVRELVGETMQYGDDYGTIQQQINITELDKTAKRFQQTATSFMDMLNQPSFLDNSTRVKKANKSMASMLKLFVRSEGLSERPFYKNALWAPNRDDGYKAQILPGSMEALQDGDLEKCREWNLWLVGAIDRAARMLGEV
jgi:N-acetylated-alpha-linked acidic dipeptidase